MDSTEFFTPLGHGIWDHSSKFLPRPLSFMLYTYMLCYAKSKGNERGLISFPIKDLATLLSYGREQGRAHDSDLLISPSSIRRALNHLEEIKFIKVLSRGANRRDDCWVISINKYKAMDNFPSVMQAKASDSPDDQPTLIPLDDSQLDTFEHKNDTLFGNEEAEEEAEEERERCDFSGLSSLPNPAVIINLMKLASASNKEVLALNRDFVMAAEADPDEKYTKALEDIRTGTYHGQSSEKILPVRMAMKMAAYLTERIRKKEHETEAENARFELVRLYWNGVLFNGKPALERMTSPRSPERTKKMTTRFQDAFFAKQWAAAVVKAKDSPHCRGENGWKANLEWFTRNHDSIRRIMENRYANGRKKQARGPTRNFDYDSYTSEEAPRSALDGVSLEEDNAADGE